MAVSSRAIKAGEAFVEVLLDDDEFNKGVDDMELRVRNIARALRPLTRSFSVLGGAISAPFVIGARSLVTYGGELNRVSENMGTGVEQLSRYAIAAELAGSNIDVLADSANTMGERLIQASEGSGEAARALEQLGISVSDVLGISNDPLERLDFLAQQILAIEDASIRAGVAQSLLQDSFLETLRAFELMETEAEFIERTQFTDRNREAAADLAGELRRLNIAFRTLAVELGTSVAPALALTAELATPILLFARDFVAEHPNLTAAVAGIGSAMLVLSGAIAAMGPLISFFRPVVAGFGRLIQVIGGFGTAVGAVAVQLVTVTVLSQELGRSLADMFTGVRTRAFTLQEHVGGLHTAMVTWLADIVEWSGLASDAITLAVQTYATEIRRAVFGDFLDDLARPTETGARGTAPGSGGLGFNAAGIAGAFASQQTLGSAAISVQTRSEDLLEQIEQNTRSSANSQRDVANGMRAR